ncbi:FtsW/RodA/SpoVE family cell cycle protein [Escherichia coli]
MEFWQRYSATMLLESIILLIIVLVVGSSVKGASRWIDLRLLRIQPAELTRNCRCFAISPSYLVRKGDEVRNNLPRLPETDGRDSGVGSVYCWHTTWYGGGVRDYAGDVVPGSKILAVHCHYRYGHFSGCVLILAKPYRLRQCSRLEPVGKSLGSGYQLSAIANSIWSRRTFERAAGNSVQKN